MKQNNTFNVGNDAKLMADILADPESPSFIILYEKYCPVVYAAIGAFHFRYYEVEDLKIEAMLICYQSVLEFDSSLHSSFGSFFKANLTNYFMTLLRNQAAQKRQIDQFMNSLDTIMAQKGSAYIGPDRSVISAEALLLLEEALAQLPYVLSQLENQVLEIFCKSNPVSRRVIAKKLGISYERFYNAATRCKKKTRSLLYDDSFNDQQSND